MAALPYIDLYISDYIADTWHISTLEHGAYLLLIFDYWQRGEAIPVSQLQKITKVPDDQWPGVKMTLSEFFLEKDDRWFHRRIDADLESARRKASGDNKRPNISIWARIRKAVFERDDYTCQYCGKRDSRLECDHVRPVSKGGSHDMLNLVTACFACNRSKRDKDVNDWLRSRQNG